VTRQVAQTNFAHTRQPERRGSWDKAPHVADRTLATSPMAMLVSASVRSLAAEPKHDRRTPGGDVRTRRQ
jgi:hypothetical protein